MDYISVFSPRLPATKALCLDLFPLLQSAGFLFGSPSLALRSRRGPGRRRRRGARSARPARPLPTLGAPGELRSASLLRKKKTQFVTPVMNIPNSVEISEGSRRMKGSLLRPDHPEADSSRSAPALQRQKPPGPLESALPAKGGGVRLTAWTRLRGFGPPRLATSQHPPSEAFPRDSHPEKATAGRPGHLLAPAIRSQKNPLVKAGQSCL